MPGREDQALARLVAYVCMIPRDQLTKEELELRRKFVLEGWTSSHMPKVQIVKTRMDTQRGFAHKYKPITKKDKVAWALV